MKEPRRLLETKPDGLSRVLLEFGAREKPGAASRHKITAAAVTAAGVAATASVAAGASTAGTLAKVGWASWVAWLGIGVLATAGLVVTLRSTKYGAPRGVGATSAAVQSVVVETTGDRPSGSAEVVERATPANSDIAVSAPAPSLPAAAKATGGAFNPTAASSAESQPRVPVASAAPSPALDRDTLALEVAQLDQARKALASGDPERALKELDVRDRVAGQGTMAHEARVLRIEALLRKGDRAGAAALAEQFLRAHTTSPYAPRVRSLLAAARGP